MWYTKSTDTIIQELHTDEKLGLSQKEAAKRLEQNGPNALPTKKKPPVIFKFFAQFKNVLVGILLFATLLSFFLGETVDAIAIAAIVVMNAVIGFAQELQAEKTLESLKETEVAQTLVVRNGIIEKIPVANIVSGDIIILEEGAIVPADSRLLEAFSLMVDESMLTGESEPVIKQTKQLSPKDSIPLADQINMVCKGTRITSGRGKAIVVATGSQSEMGKIARALEETQSPQTPLTIELARVGRTLTFLIGGIAAVLLVLNTLSNMPFVESLLISISLAVAAIPEGLPAIVTIVLSLGVKRLAAKKTIVKKLTAVETLGAVRIIATDKTGTITQNKISVVRIMLPSFKEYIIEGEGYHPIGTFFDSKRTIIDPLAHHELVSLLKASTIAGNATLSQDNASIIGDTTEGALVVATARASLHPEEIRASNPRVFEMPFTSARMMMSVVAMEETTGSHVLYTKGAPEVILSKTIGLTPPQKHAIRKTVQDYAMKGLRAIAVAKRSVDKKELEALIANGSCDENNVQFLGIVAMQDPLRPEVREALASARRAGIRTIMITGDHKDTARAIALEAGIIDRVQSEGSTIPFSNFPDVLTETDIETLSDHDLTEVIKRGANVFARISPLGKLRLIEAIKRIPHTQVAVTGDGVNDAPALQSAHIGIAMGKSGTDLTREVADMVIADDNYATIVTAVQEGRVIFANLVKFVRYLISCNISEIIVVTLGVLFMFPPPLLPIQILWINLITDGFPALALGMDPPERDIMNRPPRDISGGILPPKRWVFMILEGSAIGLTVFGLFVFAYTIFDYEKAQTMTFAALALSQLVHAFNNRSTRQSIFTLGVLGNKFLVAAFIVSTLLQIGVTQTLWGNSTFGTVPLLGEEWLLVIAVSFIPFVLVESKKLVRRRFAIG